MFFCPNALALGAGLVARRLVRRVRQSFRSALPVGGREATRRRQRQPEGLGRWTAFVSRFDGAWRSPATGFDRWGILAEVQCICPRPGGLGRSLIGE